MTDRMMWLWLNNIEGIGNIKIRRLLEYFYSPEEIYREREEGLLQVPGITIKDVDKIKNSNTMNRTEKLYDELMQKNINYVFPHESDYPSRLKELYDKPQILYYIGKIPDNITPAVAIIGSRKCTEYGKSVANELGRIMGENNVNVISGLALGIDSEAHKGTLLSGGMTYGILAGGVDKSYPMSNYNLYMDIQKQGGVVSEFPPGITTVPGMFPLRNRIVSGLSDMVIVVEAGEKSGSLITVNHALEQNRTVYAIPGRFGDKMSYGCNRLIAEGAGIVTSYEELLNELGIEYVKKEKTQNDNLILATGEKMLYSLLLDFVPCSLDTLLQHTKRPVGEVLTDLLGLELKGYIKEISKNFYVRIR